MIWYLSFSFWLTSVSMIISNCINVAAYSIMHVLSYGWVVFHCVYILHLYPFICWWTFRLLPCLGYCGQCCYEHWAASIFLSYSLVWIYAHPEVRLPAHSVILFLVFWTNSIVFSIVAIPAYIPTNSVEGTGRVDSWHLVGESIATLSPEVYLESRKWS